MKRRLPTSTLPKVIRYLYEQQCEEDDVNVVQAVDDGTVHWPRGIALRLGR